MTPATNKGIIDKPSNHSVEQTVDSLKNILQSKGVALFALVDHSGEADMLAVPAVPSIFLRRFIVWEDAQGKAWLSYNSPE